MAGTIRTGEHEKDKSLAGRAAQGIQSSNSTVHCTAGLTRAVLALSLELPGVLHRAGRLLTPDPAGLAAAARLLLLLCRLLAALAPAHHARVLTSSLIHTQYVSLQQMSAL